MKRQRSIDGRVSGSSNTNKKRIKEKNCKHEMKCTHNVNNCGYECSSIDGNPLVAQQTAEDQLRQNHDQHLQQRAIEASRHQQEMNNALVAQRTAEDQLRQNQDDQRRQHKERDKRRQKADKTHGRSRLDYFTTAKLPMPIP